MDSCNIPHLIYGLNYFIECDCENINYYDIIKAFLQPQNIKDYNDEITDESNELADWTYTIDNVTARNEFIEKFIDDYIDEFIGDPFVYALVRSIKLQLSDAHNKILLIAGWP